MHLGASDNRREKYKLCVQHRYLFQQLTSTDTQVHHQTVNTCCGHNCNATRQRGSVWSEAFIITKVVIIDVQKLIYITSA